MKIVPLINDHNSQKPEFKRAFVDVEKAIADGKVEAAFLAVLYKDGTSFHIDYSEYNKPYAYRLIGLLEVAKQYLIEVCRG